jgi:beta-galactosidase/beta-glucuronidase
MAWHPAKNPLMTRWGKTITPEKAWQEYPRPQMVRKEWKNLNGLWDYAITKNEADRYPGAGGQILVPFPLESALSGVKHMLRPDERLWYRRTFTIPKNWEGQRILLHFEAVDWEAVVWVNGKEVGTHRGGYLPFCFEITNNLLMGENALVVAVWDPTDTSWGQRGKQVRYPRGIWYTQVSGIWQTVWLEAVPRTFISRIEIAPDIDTGSVYFRIGMDGKEKNTTIIEIFNGRKKIATGIIPAGKQQKLIKIKKPILWCPENPHLYLVEVASGKDTVETYFGMRKYSLGKDARGNRRMMLNNQPYFQFGPLDQGYWPDGLYTAPSEDAMRFDLELIKRLGCNMLRKHIKVEPARYYYECDRMGIIVWQDMMNGGRIVSEALINLLPRIGIVLKDRNYRFAGRKLEKSRKDYRSELAEMIDHLYNFPCIGVWVLFNEGWGQFDANEFATWVKRHDPTRLVDHASGWFDQGGGDFRSVHVYFKKLAKLPPDKKRASVVSEFGGRILKIPRHMWNSKLDSVYKTYKTKQEFTDGYVHLLENELAPLVKNGLSAAIYTQTTDVEIEMNGFVTYDREVEKMDFKRVKVVHRRFVTNNDFQE